LKTGAAFLIALIAVGVGGMLTRPIALEAPVRALQVPADAEQYLATREAAVSDRYGIVPGAEKRIVWAGAPGERTERVVVYLHGFSATRQEIAPVPERLARALGANLFETRLAGHGRLREPMQDMQAEQWLADGVEALAVARTLGDRVILVGTSTGATLGLALAGHPDFTAVHSLVFLSPNFAPAAAGARLLTGPFGPQILRLTAGPEHAWEAANAAQATFWTTRYPSAAIIEMMRLVELAWSRLDRVTAAEALFLFSPQDEVVSVSALRRGFAALPVERKVLHPLEQGNGLSNHVLTGDILAPENTEPTLTLILDFLRGGRA
jgi:esterase/lipase